MKQIPNYVSASEDTDHLKLCWQATNSDGFHPVVLYQPKGLIYSDSNITVCEGFWPYSRVQIFSGSSGQSVRASEQGEVLPFGIATIDQGLTAVTDHHDRTVKFLSSDSSHIASSWQPALFDWPTGISTSSQGYVYIVDWLKGTAHICDKFGRIITSFSTKVSSKFSRPFDVVVDAYSRIIVSDAFSHCLRAFDESGKLLNTIGLSAGIGQICDPRGICVDAKGNIIVADWGAGAVRKFSPDGLWICDLLDKNDEIAFPWGLAMNEFGQLALTEQKLTERSSLKLFI